MSKIYFFALVLFCSCGNVGKNNIKSITTVEIDKKGYNLIKIDNDLWLSENLSATHFANGDTIFEAKTSQEYINYTQRGIPCWILGKVNVADSANLYAKTFGHLYNSYAIIDKREIGSLGFRLPDKHDLDNLITFIGKNAAYKLKDTTEWSLSRSDNETSFSALPGGSRSGEYANYIGSNGVWWTKTPSTSTPDSYYGLLLSNGNDFIQITQLDKTTANSVRLIKN